jgi:hypothetical protein
MTPSEINRAIAEVLGAKAVKDDGSSLWSIIFPDGSYGPNYHGGLSEDHAFAVCCPNYMGDLNACAEFRKTIKADAQTQYVAILIGVIHGVDGEYFNRIGWCEGWEIANATAPQHCETFLRLHGKWKE